MHRKNIYNFTQPNLMHNPLLVIVVVGRVAAAWYIFVDPVWGFIVTTLFDYLDSVILMHVGGMKRADYTRWDKYLDWVGYVVMTMVGYMHSYGWLLGLFLIHRLVGQVLYERTKKGRYFILFPNIFEMAFVWFTLGDYIGLPLKLSAVQYWTGFGLLIIFKLAQELLLHFYWPKQVKKYGYPRLFKVMGLNEKVYR